MCDSFSWWECGVGEEINSERLFWIPVIEDILSSERWSCNMSPFIATVMCTHEKKCKYTQRASVIGQCLLLQMTADYYEI